jgi:hypothetical protein
MCNDCALCLARSSSPMTISQELTKIIFAELATKGKKLHHERVGKFKTAVDDEDAFKTLAVESVAKKEETSTVPPVHETSSALFKDDNTNWPEPCTPVLSSKPILQFNIVSPTSSVDNKGDKEDDDEDCSQFSFDFDDEFCSFIDNNMHVVQNENSSVV